MDLEERISINRFYIGKVAYFAIFFSLLIGVLGGLFIIFSFIVMDTPYYSFLGSYASLGAVKASGMVFMISSTSSFVLILICALFYNLISHFGATINVALVDMGKNST